MAFQRAAGYSNLPNGVFSPVQYSKKVQLAFRKTSVVQDITNTDYFGDIGNMGDSVRIIKEPEIAVRPYARGTQVTPQDLEDIDFTLIIDRANYYAFQMDDIEKAHAHVNFMELATNRAGYRLKDTFDSDVFAYLSGYEINNAGVFVPRTTMPGTKANPLSGADELLATNKLTRGNFGASSNQSYSIALGLNGTKGTDYDATPLAVMNRMARILDEANVDTENRWFVADPVFYEVLGDENSKFLDNDYAANQNAGGPLRNGRVASGEARGFRLYKSNNLPKIGAGPGTYSKTGSNANYGVIIAGHQSAVATAETLTKNEKIRNTNSFGDIQRGMHLYGRKILRPEALVIGIYNLAGL